MAFCEEVSNFYYKQKIVGRQTKKERAKSSSAENFCLTDKQVIVYQTDFFF
jgi:hypothetical protein